MNIILLSGGSGQRLWPLSTAIPTTPFFKIFHTEAAGLQTMQPRVYRQIREADPEAKITIAPSKAQISSIHNQLGENVGISMEPCRRDTFPAIALAVGRADAVRVLIPMNRLTRLRTRLHNVEAEPLSRLVADFEKNARSAEESGDFHLPSREAFLVIKTSALIILPSPKKSEAPSMGAPLFSILMPAKASTS